MTGLTTCMEDPSSCCILFPPNRVIYRLEIRNLKSHQQCYPVLSFTIYQHYASHCGKPIAETKVRGISSQHLFGGQTRYTKSLLKTKITFEFHSINVRRYEKRIQIIDRETAVRLIT